MLRRRAKPNRKRGIEGEAIVDLTRRLLRIVVVLTILASGGGGYWYGQQATMPDLMGLIVWADTLFPITTVEINEGRKVSREEVLSLLNRVPRHGLLTTQPETLRKTLETHPWIQQADVRRVFPDTLMVEVTEREPAAVLRTGGRELLLGEDGVVIADALAGSFEGFPVLTGIDYAEALLHKAAVTERLLAGMALASLLSESGANRMEVDLRNPGDMVAYYNGVRIRFGDGSFEDKVDRYRRLSDRLRERLRERPRVTRREPAVVGTGKPDTAGPGERDGHAPEADRTEIGREPHDRIGEGRSGVEVDLRFQDRIIVRDKRGRQGWGEKTKSL